MKAPLFGKFEDDFREFKYIQVFFVDSNVYSTYSCDSIKLNQLVVKHIQVDLEQMNQRDWVLSYP